MEGMLEGHVLGEFLHKTDLTLSISCLEPNPFGPL